MTLSSMTGFARASGASGAYRWVFEVKSVNAKGLDLRLRTPPGFDRIEGEARARLGRALARGTCFATLSAQREGATLQARVNKEALAAIVNAVREAAEGTGLAPPTLDGILAIRGIVDVVESGDDEPALAAACAGALASLDEAIAALVAMRQAEGAALAAILSERLAAIAALTKAADESPARRPEAIALRLAQSVAALLEAGRGFDENRLYQEAVLLAAKADIREELDRLKTHVEAARELIRSGGPVGRRLDFLAQELAREANTLCAKANDASLTAIGLDLRVQIEQLREQIQNIE
ncbi:YicC/YloC family endoribonuclease [Methylocapsa sp. S129]|uniref:YicC/YloC family endoribonuclease n=1 Tax=Methylocapsa sp. S129 TaxID=1641869 RepID=UPI00131D09F1|nr:YicC/YloC family endoribonuclease [Methylocapsa sp. S129]